MNDETCNGGRAGENEAKKETVKVLFIHNEGAGFADYIEVPAGTTVGQLFKQKASGSPGDYTIRLNREAASESHVLHTGDRVSLTPRKIEGA